MIYLIHFYFIFFSAPADFRLVFQVNFLSMDTIISPDNFGDVALDDILVNVDNACRKLYHRIRRRLALTLTIEILILVW